jgi:hypothetical protein
MPNFIFKQVDDGRKIKGYAFRHVLNKIVHLHTKGKNPVDVQATIDILKEKVDTLQAFLDSRK